MSKDLFEVVEVEEENDKLILPISKEMLESYGIKVGDKVRIRDIDGTIVLTKEVTNGKAEKKILKKIEEYEEKYGVNTEDIVRVEPILPESKGYDYEKIKKDFEKSEDDEDVFWDVYIPDVKGRFFEDESTAYLYAKLWKIELYLKRMKAEELKETLRQRIEEYNMVSSIFKDESELIIRLRAELYGFIQGLACNLPKEDEEVKEEE